jgi:hypothetical protein
MLFKGIKEESLGDWEKAVKRASTDVSIWQDIADTDIVKATDESLFRVLEWGGMEVLH